MIFMFQCGYSVAPSIKSLNVFLCLLILTVNCCDCLTGKTEEKKDGMSKSNGDSLHTGQKSTLTEGIKYQNWVVCRLHLAERTETLH